LILPASTLAVFSLAPITRMTRASCWRSCRPVHTNARAAGLNGRTVILPMPSATRCCGRDDARMVFSFLLGANVLVEKVFAWPGIGSYAVEALLQSDFAPVQGFVLTMAVLYVGSISDRRTYG